MGSCSLRCLRLATTEAEKLRCQLLTHVISRVQQHQDISGLSFSVSIAFEPRKLHLRTDQTEKSTMQVLTSDQPMEAEATASCSHQPPQTHVNASPQVPAPAGPCTLSAGGCCTAPRKVGVLTEPGLETTVKAGARAMAVADGERSDFWGLEAEEMNSEAWQGNQHQLRGDGSSKPGFEHVEIIQAI